MQEQQGEAQALLQELTGGAWLQGHGEGFSAGCTDTSGAFGVSQAASGMNSPLPVKEQYDEALARFLEHKAELKQVLQDGGVPLDAIRCASTPFGCARLRSRDVSLPLDSMSPNARRRRLQHSLTPLLRSLVEHVYQRGNLLLAITCMV